MIFDDTDLGSILEPFSTKTQVVAFANTGDEIRFSAVFDNTYQEYGDDLQMTGSIPRLICRTVDVKNIKQTAPVLVNDVKYKIREVKPDSHGMTLLELKK